MKKKMMITCTVVLVTAAVILGFVLKNQVREQHKMNRRTTGIPTTMQLQRAWAATILFRQQTEFQKLHFLMKRHRKRFQSVQNRSVRIVTIPVMRIFVI